MGQTPTETVTDIERTRRRLDAELEELESYLPKNASIKRAAAIAVAGVAGVMLLAMVMRRRRGRRDTKRLRSIEKRLGKLEERLSR